jgi:predicted aconitase with swiveling domain
MAANRMTLTQTRIASGIWEGVLTGAGRTDAVEALHQGQRLEGLTVTAMPDASGSHVVRLAIPMAILSEGVQTVLFRAGEDVLASFTLVAGVPLEEDLRAEISLLRAELDVLKKAFRRHVAGTTGQGQIS